MPIIEDFAVVDDHNAPAEFFNVVQIVRGEQHRGAKFAIDGTKK